MVIQIAHQLLSEALSIHDLGVAASLAVELLVSLMDHHRELPEQMLDELLLLLFVLLVQIFDVFACVLLDKGVGSDQCCCFDLNRPDLVVVLVVWFASKLPSDLMQLDIVDKRGKHCHILMIDL